MIYNSPLCHLQLSKGHMLLVPNIHMYYPCVGHVDIGYPHVFFFLLGRKILVTSFTRIVRWLGCNASKVISLNLRAAIFSNNYRLFISLGGNQIISRLNSFFREIQGISICWSVFSLGVSSEEEELLYLYSDMLLIIYPRCPAWHTINLQVIWSP